MKVLLIGNSPSAFSAAQMLHDLGASLCWFLPSSWRDGLSSKMIEFVETIQIDHKIKHQKVLRVSKRFLDRDEMSAGARMKDLFRVVYALDPREMLASFEETNPTVYASLSSEMKNSLVSEMEAFEDGDFVIFAPHDDEFPNLAGPGGSPAIGELKLKDKILYGQKALKKDVLPSDQEVLIVGSGRLALEKLLTLESWILESMGNRVFIASTEEMPFAKIMTENINLREKFFRFDEIVQAPFRKKVEEFFEKTKKWNELEDYEKVKVSRPEEPIPQIVYFSGHNVTSIEKMLESERLYATLEMPAFREAKIQKENGVIDLKTIGCDQVFVFTGHRPELKKYFPEQEVGYFQNRSESELKAELDEFIKKYFRLEP